MCTLLVYDKMQNLKNTPSVNLFVISVQLEEIQTTLSSKKIPRSGDMSGAYISNELNPIEALGTTFESISSAHV